MDKKKSIIQLSLQDATWIIITVFVAGVIIVALQVLAIRSADDRHQEVMKKTSVMCSEAEFYLSCGNNQAAADKLQKAKAELSGLDDITRRLRPEQSAVIDRQTLRITHLYNEVKFNSLYPELKKLENEINNSPVGRTYTWEKIANYEEKLKEIKRSLLTEDDGIKTIINEKLTVLSRMKAIFNKQKNKNK